MILETSAYSRVLLLDTQMIFEARPLEQLPWHELSSEAILLLVTTQVMTEVDGKKRDGRLGERARAFNRLIEPNVESGTPTNILSGRPGSTSRSSRTVRLIGRRWTILKMITATTA